MDFFAKAILDYLKIKEEFNAFCKCSNLDNGYYEIFETIIFSKIISISSSKNSVKNSLNFLYHSSKFLGCMFARKIWGAWTSIERSNFVHKTI